MKSTWGNVSQQVGLEGLGTKEVFITFYYYEKDEKTKHVIILHRRSIL